MGDWLATCIWIGGMATAYRWHRPSLGEIDAALKAFGWPIALGRFIAKTVYARKSE